LTFSSFSPPEIRVSIVTLAPFFTSAFKVFCCSHISNFVAPAENVLRYLIFLIPPSRNTRPLKPIQLSASIGIFEKVPIKIISEYRFSVFPLCIILK
jgi:hypothetical protein